MSYPIIGVEIGTKFMKMSAIPHRSMRVTSWENSEGLYKVPLFYDTENKKYGSLAKDAPVTVSRSHIVYGASQFVGAKQSSPFVKAILRTQRFPFPIHFDKTNELFTLSGTSVDYLSTLFIREISDVSQRKTQSTPGSLTLAVPTHFTNEQRRALQTLATTELSCNKVNVISESVAAAISYVTSNEVNVDNCIFAHINIGCTLSLTLLELKDGTTYTIHRNIVSPVFLGDFLHHEMEELILDRFCADNDILRANMNATSEKEVELSKCCEEAIREIVSGIDFIDIKIPHFSNGVDLVITRLSRNDFFERIDPVIELLIDLCDHCFDDIKPDVVLVTGSLSKLSCFRDVLETGFGEFHYASISQGATEFTNRNVIELRRCNPTILSFKSDEMK